MRGGRKTEAETGKTRPCIVYIKNLGTPAAGAGGGGAVTKVLRSFTKLTNAKATTASSSSRGSTAAPSGYSDTKTNARQVSLELANRKEKRQSTRGSNREVVVQTLSDTSIELRTPSTATRSRSSGGGTPTRGSKPLTTPPKTPKQKDREKEKPVSVKRRNTIVALPVPKISQRRTTHNEVAASGGNSGSATTKSKMFKQSNKTMATTSAASSSSQSSLSPPPTIAASRSRRSIKPNPKYAGDDMVTPKYVAAALANESGNGRGGGNSKQLFATHDDDDLIEIDEDRNDDDEDEDNEEEDEEEDNDDELTDAAFNPHLHKSDDDDDEDDLSDQEFERQVRSAPAKRGRGRPPKMVATASKTTAATNISSVNTPNSVRSAAGSGSTQRNNNLQQLRRSIATSNITKSKVGAASVVPAAAAGGGTAGNKRKLEDSGESAVARKRIALNGANTKPGTASSGGIAASHSMPASKTKTSGGGAVRILQTPGVGAKQRLNQGQTFKINQTSRAGSGAAATPRASQQMRVPAPPPAGPAESDDVPTFTIVNIDDIINQDDVLISRSSQSTSSTTATTMNSNKSKQISPLSRGAKMQTRRGAGSSGPSTGPITHPPTPNINPPTKRMITMGMGGQIGGTNKSRPRILNSEMGKKTPAMKPLMSMGKELCNIDTEEEEDRDQDEDDDNVMEQETKVAVKKIAIRGGGGNRLPQKTQQKWLASQPPARNVLSTTANNRGAGGGGGTTSAPGDRKLTKFLGEGDDDILFKKPQQQQQRFKENADGSSKKEETTTNNMTKYLPAETTTFCEEDGRMIKKITCYETWHVIGSPGGGSGDNSAAGSADSLARKLRVQRTSLEFPLVKLANMAGRIKVPSDKWSSKITLYKVSPMLLARQTMTIFTGDLKSFNIPEEERHKYQPSCVLFRRSVIDRSKCRVPYDRAIIFKNKCFYANIDGKHINLMGAPEAVTSVKDVEILLDIVDRLSLSSSLVETVNGK